MYKMLYTCNQLQFDTYIKMTNLNQKPQRWFPNFHVFVRFCYTSILCALEIFP